MEIGDRSTRFHALKKRIYPIDVASRLICASSQPRFSQPLSRWPDKAPPSTFQQPCRICRETEFGFLLNSPAFCWSYQPSPLSVKLHTRASERLISSDRLGAIALSYCVAMPIHRSAGLWTRLWVTADAIQGIEAPMSKSSDGQERTKVPLIPHQLLPPLPFSSVPDPSGARKSLEP